MPRAFTPYRLHVILRKEDVTPEAVAGKAVVVLDIMFATTTIVSALAAGARTVIPALDPGDARAIARARPGDGCVLAGEDQLELIEGFLPPFPQAMARAPLAGKALVYSTTNGTVALRAAGGAAHVYAGSLLNGPATARQMAAAHPDLDWVIVCAGSRGQASIEDLYGAGLLVDLLAPRRPGHWELSDNARAARAVYGSSAPLDCLRDSRLGRIMRELGEDDEIACAARIDVVDFVCPLLGEGIVARPTHPAASGEGIRSA